MKTPVRSLILVAPMLAALAPLCAQPPRSGLHPVTPVVRNSAPAQGAELRIAQTQFFSYAMPEGWHVGEQGQFALSLIAQDNKALTVMVGNSGLQPNYPCDRFVYEKLGALRPRNLQLGQPVPAQPVPGFSSAYLFKVSYVSVRSLTVYGLAKCSIATSYNSAVMVVNFAAAEASQWPSYQSWLPAVSEQIAANNGGAFGRRGIMAQNLHNSAEFGKAAAAYRDWSQKNWQQVTDQRDISSERRNETFRETLGNVQSYINPYDNSSVQLPGTYKYYWTNGQGKILGSNDPSDNPNTGSTADWRQLPPKQR